MYIHVTSLDITSLRYISLIQVNIQFTKLYLSLSSEELPTESINLTINYIQYKANTIDEQDIGNFNRIKLKRLSTWDEYEQGKRKKLNYMHDLGMFGKPIDAPKNAILLRTHCKYAIKRNGTRRSR